MTASMANDNNATWTLDFSEVKRIEQLVLHTRADQYKYLTRDIIVLVEDAQGQNVYQSILLNPENILADPAQITLDFPPLTDGSRVKVKRIAAPDWSGGGSTAGDANMLSLAEIVINGCTASQGGQ